MASVSTAPSFVETRVELGLINEHTLVLHTPTDYFNSFLHQCWANTDAVVKQIQGGNNGKDGAYAHHVPRQMVDYLIDNFSKLGYMVNEKLKCLESNLERMKTKVEVDAAFARNNEKVADEQVLSLQLQVKELSEKLQVSEATKSEMVATSMIATVDEEKVNQLEQKIRDLQNQVNRETRRADSNLNLYNRAQDLITRYEKTVKEMRNDRLQEDNYQEVLKEKDTELEVLYKFNTQAKTDLWQTTEKIKNLENELGKQEELNRSMKETIARHEQALANISKESYDLPEYEFF